MMKSGKSEYNKRDKPPELREKNEPKTGIIPEDISALSHEELKEVYHKLRIHQTKLELENEKLKKAESRLLYQSEILAHIHDAVIGLDRSLVVTEWNKAAEELYGWSVQEALGRNVNELIRPEETLKHPSVIIKEVDEDGRYLGERIHHHRNGRLLWIEATVLPLKGASGEINGYVVANRDITERKRIDDELLQLNGTLKALSKSSQAMMLAQSESQYLEEVCKIVTEDCGHAMVWIGFAENDENKTIRPVANAGFEEGYLETLKLTWADTERGRGPTGTAIRTGKPGGCKNMLTDPRFKPWREDAIKRGYASSIVFPLMAEGKAFGAISIYSRKPDPFTKNEVELLSELSADLAHGITAIRMCMAQTKIEEALARERANLQTMFDVVNVGMLLIDREGVVKRINDTVSRWVGKDFSECYSGQPGDILGCIHAISHPQGCGHTSYCFSCPIRATFESVFRNRESIHNVETELSVTVDGKVVHMWIEVSADPLVLDEQPHVILVLNNITERKQAEEALRESGERFRRLFDDDLTGDYLASPDGKLLLSNPAFARLFGFSSVEDESGTSIEVLYPHPEMWRDFVDRLRKEKRIESFESERIRLDGSKIHVIENAAGTFDENGELDEIHGYIFDITERKQADKEIKSVARFPEENPNPVLRVSFEGTILFANKASDTLLETWGVRSGESLPGQWRESIREVQRTGKGLLKVSKFGERIFTLNFVFIPGFEYVNIYCLDITERKQAEEALVETKDYLDKLLNYANAPIIVWNPDMRITLFNRAFEKLTGYSAEEVIGRELAVLFPPESKEQSLESIARTAGGEYWETVEIPIRRKNGEVRIALWNSANITASDGLTIVATIAQGQDITERKKAEEKLRETNKELEQFAYVASHDLQEPLRSVNSFTELLERRYRDQLDERAKEYIGFIVDGASRMQRLIQDLLAFSKVGRINSEPSFISCNEIIERVYGNIKESIEETGAEISHGDLPVLYANETSLTQLFQNLIGNAVKFHKEGVSPRVHVSAQRKESEWLFSVKDNGIGINKKYFGKLFVIFQRLHGRDEYPGTGIGLAICKKIVESYGGRIWVESSEGEGATFYFTFPV
ncbi:MAG: PAS domain S-box protein [Candidatus Latescibacterota bacterium]